MRDAPRPFVMHGYNGVRHVVYVRYRKHAFGGYEVRRRDNDRLLGWVRREGSRWSVTVHRSAFRGIGIDDVGNPRDEVPPTMFGQLSFPRPPVTREFAALQLLYFLVQHRAPAAGFPAHRDVRVHVVLEAAR